MTEILKPSQSFSRDLIALTLASTLLPACRALPDEPHFKIENSQIKCPKDDSGKYCEMGIEFNDPVSSGECIVGTEYFKLGEGIKINEFNPEQLFIGSFQLEGFESEKVSIPVPDRLDDFSSTRFKLHCLTDSGSAEIYTASAIYRR